MSRRPALRLAAAAAVLAACGDGTGPDGPRALTAVVVSPHGPEGAAVVQLNGRGVARVRGTDARVFAAAADTAVTRVVVVRDVPGELRFTIELRDGAPPPAPVLLQVADPENRLRPSLAGYKVELER